MLSEQSITYNGIYIFMCLVLIENKKGLRYIKLSVNVITKQNISSF